MGRLFRKHSSTYTTRPHGHRVAILDKSGNDVSKEQGTITLVGQLYGTLRSGDTVAVKFPLSKPCLSKNPWQANLKRYKQLRMVTESMRTAYKTQIFPISVSSPMVAPMKRATSWLVKTLDREVRNEEMVLIEEVIGEERMFVDSVGRNAKACKTLDELIHFSYHESHGEFVICGLKGVVGADGVFHLGEPTIHSVSRSYGDSDKGADWIKVVLKEHRCTDKCRDLRTIPVDGVTERCVPSAPHLQESLPTSESTSPHDMNSNPGLSSTSPYPPPYAAVISDVITDLPPPYSELFHCASHSSSHLCLKQGQCATRVTTNNGLEWPGSLADTCHRIQNAYIDAHAIDHWNV